VALPALTWKSARNAARAALVFSDILSVMIAASNREPFRIKDFSGLQEVFRVAPVKGNHIGCPSGSSEWNRILPENMG